MQLCSDLSAILISYRLSLISFRPMSLVCLTLSSAISVTGPVELIWNFLETLADSLVKVVLLLIVALLTKLVALLPLCLLGSFLEDFIVVVVHVHPCLKQVHPVLHILLESLQWV